MNKITVPFGGFRESLYWYDVDNVWFDFIQSPYFDEMKVKDVKAVMNKITPEVRAKVNQDIAEHYVIFLNLVINHVFSLEKDILDPPLYYPRKDTIYATVYLRDMPPTNRAREVARLWNFDYDTIYDQVSRLYDTAEVDSPWLQNHFVACMALAGLVVMDCKHEYEASARSRLTAVDALRFLEVEEFYEDCFVPHGGIVMHLKKEINFGDDNE